MVTSQIEWTCVGFSFNQHLLTDAPKASHCHIKMCWRHAAANCVKLRQSAGLRKLQVTHAWCEYLISTQRTINAPLSCWKPWRDMRKFTTTVSRGKIAGKLPKRHHHLSLPYKEVSTSYCGRERQNPALHCQTHHLKKVWLTPNIPIPSRIPSEKKIACSTQFGWQKS